MRSQKKKSIKTTKKSNKLRKLRGGARNINNELLGAAGNVNLKEVQLLLDKGANIDRADENGTSAISFASDKGHLDIVQLLLEKGSNVNIQNKFGNSALIFASQNGHLEIVQLLLERGSNVNIQNKFGNSALMLASEKGHLEIVQLLLERGADINIQNKDGISELMLASRNDHLEIVQLLLDKGADVNIQNKFGDTALLFASQNGHLEIVQLLLDKGANIDDVNIQNKFGISALFIASDKGHLQIVQLLLDKGADVNIQKKTGATALMIASFNGHLEIVQLLLDKGADVNIQYLTVGVWARVGDTALNLALKKGHLEIVQLLKKHHIKFTTLGGDSFTLGDLNLDFSRDHIPIEEIYTAIFRSEHEECINISKVPFNIILNGRVPDVINLVHPNNYTIVFTPEHSYDVINIGGIDYHVCNSRGCDTQNLDFFTFNGTDYKYVGKLEDIIETMPCEAFNNDCTSCAKSKKCKYKKYSGKKTRKKHIPGKCVLKSHKANNSKYIMNNHGQC